MNGAPLSVRLAHLDKLAAHVEPAPPAPTPSEVALAKVLAAWIEWPGVMDGAGVVMSTVGDALRDHDVLNGGEPTGYGAALLDRARKAGVL